ncbi:MAG: radical SAM protein [Elusimicrobiota bacterium]
MKTYIPDIYFLKKIAASNVKRLSFPFKCSFAVTYKCNLRCKMCNIWKKNDERQEVSLADIKNFFKHADKFSWVGITGGEPFLRNDIQDISDVIINESKYLSALHYATNGFLSDRIIETVKNIRKDHKNQRLVFTVSIDGHPELHNDIRGIENLWDKAVATFIALKNISNVKAQIGFTISKYNIGKFNEMFNAFKKEYPSLNFNDINVNIFQRSSFYYDNDNMDSVDDSELYNQLNDIFSLDTGRQFSINNFLRRTYLKFYPQYIQNKKTPVKCQAMSSTFFMDPYGDIYPCAIHKRKLINMRDVQKNFKEIWTSAEAKKISDECAQNKCPVCWSPCDAFSAISSSLIKSVKQYV